MEPLTTDDRSFVGRWLLSTHSSGTSAGHALSLGNWLARQNMVKKNEEYDEEDDEEDDSIEHAPVAMDWVKDQHVERLHPKHWLGAARSLRYSADIIFEHERPFAETLHAVAIKSHHTRWPNSLVRVFSMHLRSKIS
jgi:hypothetical protein